LTFPRTPATYTRTWLPSCGLLVDNPDRLI
jgi:hypothetical protein